MLTFHYVQVAKTKNKKTKAPLMLFTLKTPLPLLRYDTTIFLLFQLFF